MTFARLTKRFGPKVVFDDFSLVVEPGGCTVILGPSGCGKTTLLRIAAGLSQPDSGETRTFARRPVAFLFQEPRLLPWKNVAANVSYVMDHREPADKRDTKARDLLDRVELSDAADLLPAELSGGMARRAALARALASPADTLLLDEPFVSIDTDLKRRLAVVVAAEFRDRSQTVLCATHDLEVAATIADRIVVFSPAPVGIIADITDTGDRAAVQQRLEAVAVGLPDP